MNIYQPVISGSLTVTGSTTFFGNITINSGSLTMTSGSLSGTASLASNALLLQGTGSVGFATTASLLQVSSSQQQISSSQQQISASLLNVVANYATTGSNSFRANQSITGSLVVSSTITAQTLVVQTVTSSIVYSSGSNNFGNQLANTQTFTGSIYQTGSIAAFAGSVGIGTTSPNTPLSIVGDHPSGQSVLKVQSATPFSSGFLASIGLNDSDGTRKALIYSNSSGFQLETGTSIPILFNPGGSVKMTLDASGSLGLGVSPVLKLDVQGNAADTGTISGVTVEQVTLFRPSNGVGGIRTGFNTTTGDAYLWSAQSGASLNFGVRSAPNNTAYLSIASTGAATFRGDFTVFSSATGATTGDLLVDTSAKYVYVGRLSGVSGDNTTFQVRDRTGTARATIPGGGSIDTVFSTNSSNFIVTNYSATALMTIANSGAATFSSTITAGNSTFANGTGLSQVTIGQLGTGYSALKLAIDSTKYSFLLGAQYNVDNGFEITPSTVVGGSTFSTPIFKILNTGVATFSNRVIASNGAAGAATISTSNSNSSDDAGMSNLNFDGNRLRLGVLPSDGAYGCIGASGAANTGLAFVTHNGAGWGERMRITPAGSVNINDTTNTTYKLAVTQTSGSPTTYFYNSATSGRVLYLQKKSADTGDYYIVCDNIVANKFLVNGEGTIYAVNTTVQSASDIRFKENIRDLETGLSEILSLKPRRFDWKEGKGMDIKNAIGFIAQEVEEILPDLVKDDWVNSSTDSTSYKSLGMTNMIPTLVKAIQELQAQITELKNK